MPELILTNGDSAAELMREAGFQADIEPWRDVLHEGPVKNLPPRECAAERARYLCRFGNAPQADIERIGTVNRFG